MRWLLFQVEPRVKLRVFFDQAQIEGIFACPEDGDVQGHDLLLNQHVLLQLVCDNVCWDLADDLLQRDVALESLIKALFEEGLADRQACKVDCLELLVHGQSVTKGDKAALVRYLLVLRDV